MLDRRQNYKIVKKMIGAKGSVRDATTALVPGVDDDEHCAATEFAYCVRRGFA